MVEGMVCINLVCAVPAMFAVVLVVWGLIRYFQGYAKFGGEEKR